MVIQNSSPKVSATCANIGSKIASIVMAPSGCLVPAGNPGDRPVAVILCLRHYGGAKDGDDVTAISDKHHAGRSIAELPQ
jgi:hypothetical protein